MVARENERAGPALHGVVNPRPGRRSREAAASSPLSLALKPAFAVLVLLSLVAAVFGGLLRAGVTGLGIAQSPLIGQAAVSHAGLMLCAFLGTAIAIERAVAIKARWAFAAPLASGLSGAVMLAGHAHAAAWLGVFAAIVFLSVNIVVVSRQRAAHTALLLAGAMAWFIGQVLAATGSVGMATLSWWFAFPVLTIAAERLEMTRLMRRDPSANASLLGIVIAFVGASAWTVVDPMRGGVLYGVALAAFAVWFGVFDIARRTALTHGLSRYMAVCLLCGYAWLGLAGVAWAGTAVGCPGRDMALHALGLGFIMSMIMGHAPVILPAVARVKLLYGPWFYAPLTLLHASLALRLFGAIGDVQWRTIGAAINAMSLAVFALTVAGSALAWRRVSPG